MSAIGEILQRIGGHRFFTQLDSDAGYFQSPIRDGNKAKIAFTTVGILCQFYVLPQGLENASANFDHFVKRC
jgi:hypothetical protein